MYSTKLDIIGLCETFLSSRIKHVETEIIGFKCERGDRSCGAKGGIVVYIKDGIKYNRRTDIEDNNIESIWIELSLSKQRILCGFIYRPPNENVSWIDDMEVQLYKAKRTNYKLTMLGDFNMNLLKLCSHSKWNMFIKSFDLQQLVTKPTRVTDTTATVIDHIYISDGLEVQEVSVPEVSLSDHFPVAMTISNSKTKTDGSHKVIEYRGKPTINYYMLL